MSFREFVIQDIGKYIPDKLWIQIKYMQWFKSLPDLKNPTTYNEKLNWLKLHDRCSEYVKMVDKYEMKKYVSELIGEQYVIPVVGGPWSSVDEIDVENLPQQFVLKTTHDCGGVYICKDKDTFDVEDAKAFLKKHLKQNYYLTSREWPYKNVKPRIFAEKYVTDGDSTKEGQLTDYKFFCFDGKPMMMFVATDRADESTETKFDFFDMEYQHLPFTQGHPNADKLPEIPADFQKMKELSHQLSKNVPHVRVDFYEVNKRVYVGELTLYHFSGLVPFVPNEWDEKIGEWLVLPSEKVHNK